MLRLNLSQTTALLGAFTLVSMLAGVANAQSGTRNSIGSGTRNLAPAQSFAPTQSFAPAQTYSAPVQSYVPTQTYSAPQSYSQPMIVSAPQSAAMPQSDCIGCSANSQRATSYAPRQYSAPIYSQPAPSYVVPSNVRYRSYQPVRPNYRPQTWQRSGCGGY